MSGLITTGQQAAAGRATSDHTVAALRQAMGVISSVCDYAQQLDARGFNAADAWLGHVLAQMPAGPVDRRRWRWPRGTCCASTAASSPPPGSATTTCPARQAPMSWKPGGASRPASRPAATPGHWREQQYRQARTYVRCDGDGEQVTLAFPYDPDLVAACRTIDGRRYDGAAKANVFPFTSLPAVIELAAAHGIEVTADVRALAAIAADRAAERAAQPQVRLDEPDGTIIIDAPFDPDAVRRAQGANSADDLGPRRQGAPAPRPSRPRTARAWPTSTGCGSATQAREFAASTSARHEQNRSRRRARSRRTRCRSPAWPPALALKPQQYPVVRFALAHRRVLIGDDMGWGKTAVQPGRGRRGRRLPGGGGVPPVA